MMRKGHTGPTRRKAVPQAAYKFEAEVRPEGKVELTVPLPPGTRVEVLVLAPGPDEFEDLVDAARSSTDFWDNPEDDAEWNPR
jgi:hypothetical protein